MVRRPRVCIYIYIYACVYVCFKIGRNRRGTPTHNPIPTHPLPPKNKNTNTNTNHKTHRLDADRALLNSDPDGRWQQALTRLFPKSKRLGARRGRLWAPEEMAAGDGALLRGCWRRWRYVCWVYIYVRVYMYVGVEWRGEEMVV